MTFDGIAEQDNIIARLKSTLAGGRVFDGTQDDQQMLHDPSTGVLLPYIYCIFGKPIAATTDRAMATGERGQPYIMVMSIVSVAADQRVARQTGAGVVDELLDFLPNNTNATALKTVGGYNYTHMDSLNRPSRYEDISMLETTINLSTR